MTDGCYCADSTPNTGVSKCPTIIRKTVGLLMTPLFASDGTRNKLDANTNAIIGLGALLTQSDKTKRIYPLDNLKNVKITPTEPKTRTFDDDSTQVLTEGIYQFEGVYGGDGAPAPLVGALNGVKCSRWAVYLLTSDGHVVGERESDGFIYPIEWQSFNAQGMFASDDALADIMIKFNLNSEFKYEKLYQLPNAKFDVDTLTVEGVTNASLKEVGTTTTTVTNLLINHNYGEGFINTNIVGLTLSDFLVTNETTGLPVTVAVTTAIIGGADVYVLTASAAQTSADVLRIDLLATSGFEGTVKVTIP